MNASFEFCANFVSMVTNRLRKVSRCGKWLKMLIFTTSSEPSTLRWILLVQYCL